MTSGMEAVIPSGAVPLAPYTPAIKANGLVFCSGQIGMVNGTLVDGVQEQTRVALNGVKALLEAAGTFFGLWFFSFLFVLSLLTWRFGRTFSATFFFSALFLTTFKEAQCRR